MKPRSQIAEPEEMSPAVGDGLAVSGPAAVGACTVMALLYVAILYSPTMLLRLPPPATLNSFMIRRFACAAVASVVSVLACSVLLRIGSFRDLSLIFSIYGIRVDHLWRAIVLPAVLTSLLYAGSLMSGSILLVSAWRGAGTSSDGDPAKLGVQGFLERTRAAATNVLAWRNYVVAPFTEEVVFRACMIPLLLCGGFTAYKSIVFSPIFFSLAHLNHFLELYCQQRYSFLKAFMIVGLQLGYTVMFGWYASFLFIRTGNLICPIVAHIFCNVMGLPILSSSHAKGLTRLASVAGFLGFFWLLFPATEPDLYNDTTDNCNCWHGYCNWK